MPGGAVAWVVAAGVLPLVAVSATAFAKISVVLGILRGGLGVPGALPAPVVAALAAVLAAVVMAPVAVRVADAVGPDVEGPGAWSGAAERAWPEVAAFLDRHTRPEDRALVAEVASRLAAPGATGPVPAGATGPLPAGATGPGPAVASGPAPAVATAPPPSGAHQSPAIGAGTAEPPAAAVAERTPAVRVAAFLVSELNAAFSLGFLVLLPFLVLDLLVAHTLAVLGFHLLPPALVALPFKLLLFVAAGGFGLVVRGLVGSYA